jgi:hypothetical protein
MKQKVDLKYKKKPKYIHGYSNEIGSDEESLNSVALSPQANYTD